MAYGVIGMILKLSFFGPIPEGTVSKGSPFLFIGWLVVLMGFYIYFWRRAGQTVGMRAWRLYLIQDSDSLTQTNETESIKEVTPSIKQCILRCIVAVLGFTAFGVGYFWCLFDKNKLTLQDHFSQTRIIVSPKVKKDVAHEG